MKSLTKLLIAILVFTTLIPLYVAILCLFDQPGALKFFHLESLSPDLRKVLFLLGGFVLSTAALPILSIFLLIKQKQEGFTLAYITGLVALIRGILTFITFNSNKISDTWLPVTPIVIGTIILLVTFIARKQYYNKVRPMY